MTHSPEVEKLARTLKQNRIAVSESEAYRMAEEMLHIGKKVSDDFKERDSKIYGQHKQSNEMDTAHKMMEKISQNMASGKSDVRVDIQQLDGRPLKQLIEEQEEPLEQEEDDAILLKDNTFSSDVEEPAYFPRIAASENVSTQKTEAVLETQPQEMPEHFGKAVTEPEKISIETDDEDLFDDEDDEKDSEEESLHEEALTAAEEASSTESSEEKASEEVEVKEIYF